MNLENIDLDKIKLAIFDFDGTLAIHKDKEYDKHRKQNKEKYYNYHINSYLYPDTFFEEIEPCVKSERLFNFINKLREKHIKIYCLSGMKFSFHLNAKKSFIKKYYGSDIEVLTCGTQELKLESLKMICLANNCKLDEIIFFDDKEEVVDLLNSNNIKAILVNGYEEINDN